MMLYDNKKTTVPKIQNNTIIYSNEKKTKKYFLSELQKLSDSVIVYLKENNFINIQSNLIDIEADIIKTYIEDTQDKLKKVTKNEICKDMQNELIKALQYLIYLNLLRVLVEYNNKGIKNDIIEILFVKECIEKLSNSDKYRSLLLPCHLYELTSFKNKIINGDIIMEEKEINEKSIIYFK